MPLADRGARGRRAAAGAGAAAGTGAGAGARVPSGLRARVGFAHEPGVFDSSDRLVPAVLDAMLDRALGAAFGVADAVAALRTCLQPSDVVGLKVNCLAGHGLSTHPELVFALVGKLVRAGIRAENVVVWDRSDTDLKRARYTIRRSGDGPLFYGTNDDYERDPIDVGSVGGCLSRILTRRVTAIINVPIVKDHDLAGISGGMKSFYGAIHNPNRYHDNHCSPYVADLFSYPVIRGKVRLTIFDALAPQYHGGPAFVPAHTWRFASVFASTDPVAADAIALKIVREKRRQAGMDSLEQAGRPAVWLEQAAGLGLGIGDERRIDEVRR